MKTPILLFLIFFLFAAGILAQTETLPATDPNLQQELEGVIGRLGLQRQAQQHRMAISLMDITDPAKPRYAGLNDRDMMYAASLPKIAIVLAGFEAIQNGLLQYTPSVKAMFVNLIRFSSNSDASRAIHAIGFDYIARVLTSPLYRLYDPILNGGLWIGKAYGSEGGLREYWKQDPLAGLSHAANSLQVARFFWMMDQGKLVSPEISAEIKNILAEPGIHHKFVKGLESLGVQSIYRKSGTWRDAHCDAALVEHNGRKYIAVALMKDARGGDILPKLIVHLHSLVVGR